MIINGLNTSITGRAIKSGLLKINAVNIRDYSDNKHNRVDDYTYGGGAGMLMQAEPVYRAYKAACEQISLTNATSELSKQFVKTADSCQKPGQNQTINNAVFSNENTRPRCIYVTPQGAVFNQTMACDFAKEKDLIILCGHYEGIDERVLEEVVTDYVSIGDYVLTGGELAAMVLVDAISRLVPGVLHNEESSVTESFYGELLEYPQYSRPETWHEKSVPSELLTGNPRIIGQYRRSAQIERTRLRRPDLYERFLRLEKAKDKMLKADKLLHIDMIEHINRGTGKLVYMDENQILLEDTKTGTYYHTAVNCGKPHERTAVPSCDNSCRSNGSESYNNSDTLNISCCNNNPDTLNISRSNNNPDTLNI